MFYSVQNACAFFYLCFIHASHVKSINVVLVVDSFEVAVAAVILAFVAILIATNTFFIGFCATNRLEKLKCK